jgi:alpha-tubulin suppressor-like RCC1 family protein
LSDLKIIDTKCSAIHSIGLTQSGEVYGWGGICGERFDWGNENEW